MELLAVDIDTVQGLAIASLQDFLEVVLVDVGKIVGAFWLLLLPVRVAAVIRT